MWMRSRTGGRLAQRTRWLSVEPRTATLHGLELTVPAGTILASICGLGKRRTRPTRSTQLASDGHQVSTGGEALGTRYLRVASGVYGPSDLFPVPRVASTAHASQPRTTSTRHRPGPGAVRVCVVMRTMARCAGIVVYSTLLCSILFNSVPCHSSPARSAD